MIRNSLVTRFTKEHLGIYFAKRIVKNIEISFLKEHVYKIKNIISKIYTKKDSFFEKIIYYRLTVTSSSAFTRSIGLKEILIDNDLKITAT